MPMCVISALKTKRLLQKGCKAYLAHVINTLTLKVTLKSVPVVREFSDMFLEDLLKFPPNIDLDFGIDLLPRSAFIFIPPRRMATTELIKLKT